jgi:hypothetical protein
MLELNMKLSVNRNSLNIIQRLKGHTDANVMGKSLKHMHVRVL